MIYILDNETMRVKISSLGAEPQSMKRKSDDTEYLWQAGTDFWPHHSVTIFPFCGRLTDGKYTYRGNTYSMGIHGFARDQEWGVVRQTSSALTLGLKENEKTLEQYPFPFYLEKTYTLTGNTLKVALRVQNTGSEELIFTVGGHPAFNVPLSQDEDFDDYYLEFDEAGTPNQLCNSDSGYFRNQIKPFPLEDGRVLALSHRLFDHDAIFLQDMCHGVTLKSRKCDKSIYMSMPDAKYVGLWHTKGADAPFLCIEPWCGVPADEGKVDDLESKREMFRLAPKGLYQNTFAITFG